MESYGMEKRRLAQPYWCFGLVALVALASSGFLSSKVSAITVSDDFAGSSRYDSGELVWNTVRGQIHPPLQVYQYFDTAFDDKPFVVGQGEDGAFIRTRYEYFSENGDLSSQIIRLNTDDHPVLSFTRFELEAGWTLQPVGSKELVIRVLGDVLIDGVINCSGENGEDLGDDPNVAANGGSGRCGGGNGGYGGALTIAAGNGFNGGEVITDGVSPGVDGPTPGSGATATESGGGGGASYAVARGAGFDPLAGTGAGGGDEGLLAADTIFAYTGGGFGGGGGGYYNSGTTAQNSSGGGGGAGGGYIFITAAGTISITGQVYADGGDGGDTDGTKLAGGGGGGGGGSIAMFAGGEIYLAGAAEVSAGPGLGQGPAGAAGGDGAAGRTWLVGQSGYSILVAPVVVAEFPDPMLGDVGATRYQVGTFTVVSGEIDLYNTIPRLIASDTTEFLPGLSSLLVEVASGPSGFTPTWVDVSTVPIDLARFARFRITLENDDDTNPATVDDLTWTLSGYREEDFAFVSACGAVQGAHYDYLFLCLLPIAVLFSLRFNWLRFRKLFTIHG